MLQYSAECSLNQSTLYENLLYAIFFMCSALGVAQPLKNLCSGNGINIIRRLLENYFVLLTNRVPPQISDNRPDRRQKALFVTIRAAWRWDKMLPARENVDSPLAAMVLATEHNALCASGCQAPSVDNGTGSRLNPVPAVWSMLAYLETLASMPPSTNSADFRPRPGSLRG